MNKHTPGPWVSGQCLTTPRDRKIRYYVNATDEEATRICDTPVSTLNGHAEANARLIAAAPALLEALEEFVEDRPANHLLTIADMQAVSARMDKARAAIKQARGES